VLCGEAELLDAVQPISAVPGLSAVPCGPRPANPAELLTSPRFVEMLNVLRDRFDFVLLDTPPLLAVSDPSVVAPRVDGVILGLRLSKNVRPHAERAKEILASLGANVLGVVINGLDGYASNYGYAYAYEGGYEDDDAEPTDAERRPPTRSHLNGSVQAPST
jgi:succinoglycan biosynthesis transport protein ExoP